MSPDADRNVEIRRSAGKKRDVNFRCDIPHRTSGPSAIAGIRTRAKGLGSLCPATRLLSRCRFIRLGIQENKSTVGPLLVGEVFPIRVPFDASPRYGFPGALVRERGGPPPGPSPVRMDRHAGFPPEATAVRINRRGGAHAAGAVSPQERLTSTHNIDETEKKPPTGPAASGVAGEQLNLNNAGTPINSGIFAAVAQPVRAAVS